MKWTKGRKRFFTEARIFLFNYMIIKYLQKYFFYVIGLWIPILSAIV